MTSIMGDCCVSETSKVYDLKAALELFTSALRMYELFTANGAMREADFNLVSASLRNSFRHNELPITVLRLKQLAENRSGSFDELNQFCVEQVVDTGASNMCISHSLQVCEDRFNLYVDVDEEWKRCLVHKSRSCISSLTIIQTQKSSSKMRGKAFSRLDRRRKPMTF